MNYFGGEFLSEWLQFSEESYNCLLQETTVSNSPLNFMSRLFSYCGAVYKKNLGYLTVMVLQIKMFLFHLLLLLFLLILFVLLQSLHLWRNGQIGRRPPRFEASGSHTIWCIPCRTLVWVIIPSQTSTRDKHSCCLWDSNPRSHRLRDYIPTP